MDKDVFNELLEFDVPTTSGSPVDINWSDFSDSPTNSPRTEYTQSVFESKNCRFSNLYYLTMDSRKSVSSSASSPKKERRALFRADSQVSLDSEKSYKPLIKKTEFYETITYLPLNLVWMFIVASANIILFVLDTYEVFFDESLYHSDHYFSSHIFFDVIVIIDNVTAILHAVWTKYAIIKDLPPRHKTLIIIDITSMLWLLIDLVPQLHVNQAVRITSLVFATVRLYRVFLFFYKVSSTPGLSTFGILLEKYGTILFFITHTFACIMMAVDGCKANCKDKVDWTITIKNNVHFNEKSPFQWYIVTMYFILGSINTTGFGNICVVTDREQIIMSILMIVGFLLVQGAFLGAWTTVKMESYRRHAIYSNRYNVISRVLTHPRISPALKEKVMYYYYTFWHQQKGIRNSEMLEMLPDSLIQQVHLDRYWNALKQTYLLKTLHPSFQRAIAKVMTTEIYTTGEVIYTQGQLKDTMVYVLKGNVQILSAEDGESPILTLGIGTCLGEVSLIYSTASPVQVIASSYSVIQCLNKKDFWKVATEYRKLNQIPEVFKKLKKKMVDATKAYNHKQNFEATQAEDEPREQALKQVKSKLKAEDPKSTTSAFVGISNKSQNETAYYSDLYIVSLHQTYLKHSDEICLHTSWPWVLQPSSEFLTFWEYLITFTVFCVAMLYPYQIAFARSFPGYLDLYLVLVDTIYFIDIILQIFTAVEDEHGIITKVSDIFKIRIRQLSFLFDVISVVPVSSLAGTFNLSENERVLMLFQINRLFKVHRVFKFLDRLANSFGVNVALVRCVEYVTYLLFISYFMGAIFYMLACFYEKCLTNSWFNVIKKEDIIEKTSRYKSSFQLSIYFALMVISSTGFGDITPYTMIELTAGMVFFITGILVFSYLVADYSATLMLADLQRTNYIEMVAVVKKYFTSNNMLPGVQARTDEYLALQWRVTQGYNILYAQSLMFDVPLHLYNELQISRYSSAVSRIPLFQGLDSEIIRQIAIEVVPIYFPQYEVVMYARSVVREMYIIDRGYCEIVSAASGKREKVLGPLDHICDFDMLLERPAVHIIRAMTHTRLGKIPYKNIKKILVAYDLDQELNEIVDEYKTSLDIKRMFLRKANIRYRDRLYEKHKSWFIFPRGKLHPLSIDYEKGFKNMGFWQFCKAFLMRRTIMPDGTFIMMWEMFQGIRIFIMSMYYISVNIADAYYANNIFIWGAMDVLGYIDLYIRMHVCFYNDKGILVTHPRYTALHYLSRSFIIDFISLLPLPYILTLMVAIKGEDQRSTLFRVRSILRLNRLLQVYRIPEAFFYFERDFFTSRKLFLNIIKFLVISIAFFNAFANILLAITCRMGEDNDGYITLTPDSNSWIRHAQHQFSFNATEPLNLYITAYYWVAITALGLGFGDIAANQVSEMYFVLVVIIAGYLLFTYILVVISSSKACIDINSTIYQENMKHLISYMLREKINRELRKKVIEHFENIWQRTHGMRAKQILGKLHLTLRQDAVLYLYEDTLRRVPIFTNLTSSFYRLIGMNIQEAYVLKGEIVIRLNDVIDTFYIIHKGEATVIGADGSTFATLCRGCVFGNLEKVGSTRSMVSVIASTGLDLVYLKTDTLYKYIVDFPVVGSRLQRHILEENFSYIEKKNFVEQMHMMESTEYINQSKKMHETWLGTIQYMFSLQAYPLVMMLMSFLSCLITLSHLAFQTHTLLVFILIYSLDIIHIAKLCIGFFTPYKDDRGDLVTDLYKIRHRFLTPSRFYIELLALLPFEIFCVLAPIHQKLYYLSWLRINRMLRAWNIYHFFNVKFDSLNINVLLIKTGSICIYFILMIHTGACILYMMACPKTECLKTSWVYSENGKSKCHGHYICSLYYMISMTTFTGFGDISPRTIPEILLCIFMALLGKFIMALFLGDISAMIQNNCYTLVNYDFDMSTMKQYLRSNYITGPLINRVMNYVESLWERDRGLQLPVLLDETPSYLLEDVKAAAYGKHLYENYIFVCCHHDFLRLLIAKLKAHTYFKDDIICHQGDINNTMYFVHKGIVNVYDIMGRDEIEIDQLNQLDCFGVIQGLYANTPHTHTYKAQIVSVILTLDLFDWVDLLKYYRAARYEIYDRIQKIGPIRF